VPSLFLVFSFVTPSLVELPPALQTKALSSPTKTKKKRDNAVKIRQGDKITEKGEIEQYKNLDMEGARVKEKESGRSDYTTFTATSSAILAQYCTEWWGSLTAQ
jgi:hypothetical protein